MQAREIDVVPSAINPTAAETANTSDAKIALQRGRHWPVILVSLVDWLLVQERGDESGEPRLVQEPRMRRLDELEPKRRA